MANPYMKFAAPTSATTRADNPYMRFADPAHQATPLPSAAVPVAEEPPAPKPVSFMESLGEVPVALGSGMGRFAGVLEQGIGKGVEGLGSLFDGNENPQHYNKLERIGRIISRRGEDITERADLYEPVSVKGKVAKVAGEAIPQIVATMAGARFLPGGTGVLSKSLQMAVASAPTAAAYSAAGESLAQAGASLLGEEELAKTLEGNAALRIAADLGLNTALGVATDLGFAKLGQLARAAKARRVQVGNVADLPQEMPLPDPRALPPGQYDMPGVPEPITDPSRMLPQSTMIPGVAGDFVQGPALPLRGPAQPETIEQVIARATGAADQRAASTAVDPRIEVIPAYEPRSTRRQNVYRGVAEASQTEVDRAATSNRTLPMANEEATAALESARIAGEQARRAQGGGVILNSFGIPSIEMLRTEVGRRALRSGAMVGTGLTMQESEDERLQATGKELVAWGILHALYPSIKAGGVAGGTKMREALMQSPTGIKVLNALSYDLTADPRLKDFAEQYQQTVAKGKARAAELGQLPKGINAAQDRRISDMIEQEAFEPITGEDTPAMMAYAQRLADEYAEMGRLKVDLGLLTGETVESFDGRYMKRMYGEKLGEAVTNEVPMGPGRKVRITGERARQDLPDDVRNALGEIREGSFRTAASLEQSYRDIAAAKLFHDISSIPGAVLPESAAATKAFRGARAELAAAVKAKAPKDDIQLLKMQMQNAKAAQEALAKDFEKVANGYVRLPDTPGMGTLRNVVVRKDVADYLNMLPTLEKGSAYLKALHAWKMGKTVLNPGTHVGNMMSNVVMAHMGGLPIHRVLPALKRAATQWSAYDERVRYLAERGTLERGLPTFGDQRLTGTMEDKLRALFETTRPETQAALSRQGITPKGPVRKAVEKGIHKAEELYGKEDGLFRVALFNKLVDEDQMPWEEAAKFVQHQFVDYSTRSPILRTISRTASPFVMFTAKALPRIMDQVIEKPERWMTLMALWGGMDQYSRSVAGPLDFADLPEQERGKGYTLPRAVQLPWSDEEQRKAYLDLTRWTPFSSLAGAPAPGSLAYQMNPGIPQILQPTGPLLDIGARLANTDPYTGDKILNSAMSPLDKMVAVGKSATQLAAPTAIGFHVPKITDDILNADHRAAMIDALGLLGMKPRVVYKGREASDANYDYDRELSWLRQRYRRELRRAENNPARQDRIADEYQAGLERAVARYKTRLGVQEQQEERLAPKNQVGSPSTTFTPR